MRISSKEWPDKISPISLEHLLKCLTILQQSSKLTGEYQLPTYHHLANAAFIAALGSLAACATPAVETDFRNTMTISKSEDAVWSELIAYFTSNNIQIKTIERDSGVIYAERARFDPDMASCTVDPFLTDIGSSVSMNVFVRELAPTQTQLTVNADFGQVGYYGARPIPLNCFSTGVLEASILNTISRAPISTPVGVRPGT